MRNSIVNLDNSVLHRLKPVLLLGSIVCAFLVQGCVRADTFVGQLVNTNQVPFKSNPEKGKNSTFDSSPGIVLAESKGWKYVISVDGKTGWVKQPLTPIGQVHVNGTTNPLDATTLPIDEQGSENFKWISIDPATEGKITSVTNKNYNHTPAFVEQSGRSNFVADEKSPYYWPDLQLAFKDKRVWASITNLKFFVTTKEKFDVNGIVMRPFLSLLPAKQYEFLPPASNAYFINMSQDNMDKVQLPEMKWQLESAIIFPKDGVGELGYITYFTDSAQESYALVLNWRNGKVQYLVYTGWQNGSMETISSPILLRAGISQTKSNRPIVYLAFAHVGGDDYAIERISIENQYNANMPRFKITPVNENDL